MFMKIALVFAIALFGCAHAQVTSLSKCPANINVVPNFNVEQYLGLWYEYAKYQTIFEQGGKCTTAQYSLQPDGNVGVKNTLINATGEVDSIEGYAVPVENAKLLVVFPGTPSTGATSNYWVLDTDYTSYSVVYSCQSLPVGSASFLWILTREAIPPQSVIDQAICVLNQYNLSTSSLIYTDQTNCQAAIC